MSTSQTSFSDIIQKALAFAACRHKIPRKGTDIPYITHPAHVAIILTRHGFEDQVLAAAILHDVLEDTETSDEELLREFGPQVTQMVREVSEPQMVDRPKKETWDLRKAAKLKMLEKASCGALAIVAADRVHNTASILRDIEEHGSVIWTRFNSSPEKIMEFGRKVLEILRRRFPHQLTEEYAALHGQLEDTLEKGVED
ncbi:HD domain-containing protein [Candidatus Zixiibacteriota bacterium]